MLSVIKDDINQHIRDLQKAPARMAVPAMSTRPRTSTLRMPATHPYIRNANHRLNYLRQLSLNL